MNIVTYPNDILLQKCQKIDNIEEVSEVIEQMKDFVANKVNGAAGLALPQVGILLRGFVAKIGGKIQECLNPVILETIGKPSLKTEGCLSIPRARYYVSRYSKIKVAFKDLSGKTNVKYLTGFDASVFQHEYDHLDGKLINRFEIQEKLG